MTSPSDKHISQSSSGGPRDEHAGTGPFSDLNGTFLSFPTTTASEKEKNPDARCSNCKQHKERVEILESMLAQLEADQKYAQESAPETVTVDSEIPARETTALRAQSNRNSTSHPDGQEPSLRDAVSKLIKAVKQKMCLK